MSRRDLTRTAAARQVGFHHSAHLAYGLHIPVTGPVHVETDRLAAVLAADRDRWPDVRHLTAGPYDSDRLFLVTQRDEIDLGSHGELDPVLAVGLVHWDRQLIAALDALNYTRFFLAPSPGWLCIPDMS